MKNPLVTMPTLASMTDLANNATTTLVTTIATTTPVSEPSGGYRIFSQGEKLAVSIMLTVFSIFGTLGNGLVVYVFTRKSDKVTSTIFILSLAWCDFFTSLIIMPYTVADIQLEFRLVYDVVCKLYIFLINNNVPLSVFIMVAVAVDRYFSICHPFLHAVTPRRARISILLLCLFCFTVGVIVACQVGVYQDQIICRCVNDTISIPGAYDDVTTTMNANEVIGNNMPSLISPQGSANVTRYVFNDSHPSFPSEGVRRVNETSTSQPMSCIFTKQRVYNENGECRRNDIIFSFAFHQLNHKIYLSFYIICFVAVFIIYLLIYVSVVKRRAWRRKQKSRSRLPLTATLNTTHAATVKTTLINHNQNADGETMELNLKSTNKRGNSGDNGGGGDGSGDADEDINFQDDLVTDSGISGCKTTTFGDLKSQASQSQHLTPPCTGSVKILGSHENGTNAPTAAVSVSVSLSVPATLCKPSLAERKTNREWLDFMANIRTAVMLFVVFIVTMISFLPGWLIEMDLIEYHVFVFYMYFFHNVANPVIYAFMNESFRKELRKVFQRGTHFFRSG